MSPEASLTGLRKAAILMVALGEEASARLMRTLQDDELKALSEEIARIDYLDPDVRDAVLEEYQEQIIQSRGIERGGPDLARRLVTSARPGTDPGTLVGALDPAAEGLFAGRPAAQVARAVRGEPPQTVALLLAQMNPEHAAEVMKELPEEGRGLVATRVAALQHIAPEVIHEVAEEVGERLDSETEEETAPVDGVGVASELLSRMSRAERKAILSGIAQEDPALADQLRGKVFTFDEVRALSDKDMQELLKNTDTKSLARALKGVTEDLAERFFSNMSERAGNMLREEVEFLGAIKVAEIEESQRQILDTMAELEADGVITIDDAAEEEVV